MVTIKVNALSRSYETYQKTEGLWKSIEGLWARKTIQKVALYPTTLEIEGGQILGLVGSNGAGKTTLLKLLSGLIHPTSGTASVLGFDPSQRKSEFLKKISILLGQKNQLWWDLPASDSYELLGKIYELDMPKTKKRIAELSELLKCSSLLNIQLRRLSLGERMKMELIGALLHDPEVLFLDEPTIGLDIVTQTTIREFLGQYVRERRPTLILTSHYMDDISLLANRLLLISQGRIVFDGPVENFMAHSENRQTLSFKFTQPPSSPLALVSGHIIEPGTHVFRQELLSTEVGEVLKVVMQQHVIQEISIEEVEFEDVIRQFLQQNS